MAWSREPDRRRGLPTAQRARIMDLHGTVCHLCHHPGAEQVDHIINVKMWLKQGYEGSPHRDSNLAPAHGQPCLMCGVRCHVVKTQSEAQAARPSRRRIPEGHPGRLK